jgi:hypothetical protein
LTLRLSGSPPEPDPGSFVPAPGTTATAVSLGAADGAVVGLAVSTGPLPVAEGVERAGVDVAVDAGDGTVVGAAVAGSAVGAAVAFAVGAAVALAVGAAVGRAVGAAVGRAVGAGVGFGVGAGVGFGVGGGVGGTVIVTDPPANVSLKRSRPRASNVTVCVPAGSLPDQVNCTPSFQLVPLVLMSCALPATWTLTQSAADPSRLR